MGEKVGHVEWRNWIVAWNLNGNRSVWEVKARRKCQPMKQKPLAVSLTDGFPIDSQRIELFNVIFWERKLPTHCSTLLDLTRQGVEPFNARLGEVDYLIQFDRVQSTAPYLLCQD